MAGRAGPYTETRGGGNMTRGPVPQKSIDTALPVARTRGRVVGCTPGRQSTCDFVICEPVQSAFVRVRPARHLHCPVPEIQDRFAEPIGRLRLVPDAAGRSRELWVVGQYGTIRFFRIGNTGLTEIDRTGNVPGST